MDEIEVDTIEEPSLTDPVLIEGLPGVGNVGTLVAEHLIEELDSTLIARVHTEHFPPQVTIEDTRAELTASELYAVDLDGRDAIVLTGDHQPQTPEGHYRVTEAYLDVAERFGVDHVYAIGGVPTGELIDEYEVLAVVTADDLEEPLSDAGAVFREGEPAGGIIGVSGLLLGLGERRGFTAACLMGETSGYLVDPKSASRIIDVLGELLSFEVDMSSMDERAEEMEAVMQRLQEFEAQADIEVPGDEDLRYIG